MVVTNENFVNNNPIGETDTVIIVPTYDGHLMFLKKVLQQYKETGKYVICSYDRHTETPPSDILDVPDAWVWKHKTYGAEKRNGWLWDIVYAAGIVESFQNVRKVVLGNGDCIWDKPEGLNGLIDRLGVYDILSASSDTNLIHTCNMIWSRECFITFVEDIKDALNQNLPASHSPEVLLRDFMKQNNTFVNIPVQKQPMYPKKHFYGGRVDHYSAYHQDSTFKEVVGYRNLGGEHKAACQEHLEPVPREYFDLRQGGKYLNQHERNTLLNYYLNNDRRWLYKYWAEGEDSYWNRRYHNIEYYGDEPLDNDSKRKELGPPSERLGHFNRWKYNSFVLKDDEYKEKWKEVIDNGG
jgi:hypothetical protein